MNLWFIFQIFLICQHFSILLFFNAFLFILQVSNFDTLSWKQDQRYFNPKSAANYKDFMETHSIIITTLPIWSARSSQSTYQINLSIQGLYEGLKISGCQYYLVGKSAPPGWNRVNWFAKIWAQGRQAWYIKSPLPRKGVVD